MCKSESLSKSRPHPEAHEGPGVFWDFRCIHGGDGLPGKCLVNIT